MLLLTRYYTSRDTESYPPEYLLFVFFFFLFIILASLSIELRFNIEFGKGYTGRAQY